MKYVNVIVDLNLISQTFVESRTLPKMAAAAFSQFSFVTLDLIRFGKNFPGEYAVAEGLNSTLSFIAFLSDSVRDIRRYTQSFVRA